ncbi:hypothetical protein VTK26DRAFT_3603 [Humicola hyalothermophila]
MEVLRTLVESLKNRLWDRDVAAAAAAAASTAEVFATLLRDIEHHAAARLLLNKPLHQPLLDRDIKAAKAFLARLYDEQSAERKWNEKASYFKRLDPESLAVAIVIGNTDKISRHATDTIQALCQGAEKIAKWSPWRSDARFQALVQKTLEQQASTSSADSPAQPAESLRITLPQEEEPLIFRCSSCSALLDLEQIFNQATCTASPDPQIADTPATFGDRSNQSSTSVLPLWPTTSPAVPTDATRIAAELSRTGSEQALENQSTINSRKKRPREEDPGNTLEATASVHTGTSQPHGIGSWDAFPNLPTLSSAWIPDTSVPPGPHPIQPSPSAVQHASPGQGYTSPCSTPSAAQPNSVNDGPYGYPPPPVVDPTKGPVVDLTKEFDFDKSGPLIKERHVIYRLGEFLSFVKVHFPQTIEFTMETIGIDSIRYSSARFRDVWFQVTPAWLEARGLLPLLGLPSYVPRTVLREAILDYLREFQSYGFHHTIHVGELQNPEHAYVINFWWWGNVEGDGAVWPLAFGDLLIKWLRPGSLRDFLDWVP